MKNIEIDVSSFSSRDKEQNKIRPSKRSIDRASDTHSRYVINWHNDCDSVSNCISTRRIVASTRISFNRGNISFNEDGPSIFVGSAILFFSVRNFRGGRDTSNLRLTECSKEKRGNARDSGSPSWNITRSVYLDAAKQRWEKETTNRMCFPQRPPRKSWNGNDSDSARGAYCA